MTRKRSTPVEPEQQPGPAEEVKDPALVALADQPSPDSLMAKVLDLYTALGNRIGHEMEPVRQKTGRWHLVCRKCGARTTVNLITIEGYDPVAVSGPAHVWHCQREQL